MVRGDLAAKQRCNAGRVVRAAKWCVCSFVAKKLPSANAVRAIGQLASRTRECAITQLDEAFVGFFQLGIPRSPKFKQNPLDS
jgi:hypothetical protein